MALRFVSLLVLVGVAVRESCLGTSSHSLKFFSTTISEPSQGQPHHATVGFVDGQAFLHYDNHSRRVKPRVSWMEQVRKDEPQYWERNTQRERLHTWQWMYGCEVQADGRKGGFMQHGYEGRTFLTFDKETLTWVAPIPQAQIIRRNWDANLPRNQYFKSYLEVICTGWLEKYVSYGKETLLKEEPPEVTMSRKTEVEDGMETHVCRLDGFYPREIDASWTRDGEDWLSDTFRGSVAPNADGTFHAWLSIRIDPQDRGRYRCHVEHDGLEEPLHVALEEPKSNLGLIIGCIVAGLLSVCAIVGLLAFISILKRRQDDYRAAPSELSSLHVISNSEQGPEAPSLDREISK